MSIMYLYLYIYVGYKRNYDGGCTYPNFNQV